MTDLLPCPKGCHADHLSIRGKQVRWVQCVMCGWCGPSFATKDEAIAAWNTRAPADGWQGIETAPKDGTEILTYRQAGLISVATYWPHGKAFWCATDGAHLLHVTHWQPLPAPPQKPQD